MQSFGFWPSIDHALDLIGLLAPIRALSVTMYHLGSAATTLCCLLFDVWDSIVLDPLNHDILSLSLQGSLFLLVPLASLVPQIWLLSLVVLLSLCSFGSPRSTRFTDCTWFSLTIHAINTTCQSIPMFLLPSFKNIHPGCNFVGWLEIHFSHIWYENDMLTKKNKGIRDAGSP